jgi:hypothetical protein
MSVRTITRDGKKIEIETLPDLPGVVAIKRKRTPYLHEDLSRVILGLNSTGRVWVYLLRQHKMRPHSPIAVSSKHLKEMGVNRFAKAKAIKNLERMSLIETLKDGNGRNPRVKLLV